MTGSSVRAIPISNSRPATSGDRAAIFTDDGLSIPRAVQVEVEGDLRRLLEGLFDGRHGYRAVRPEERLAAVDHQERGELQVVAVLHAVVIALAAGVRSVRIGVGPGLIEIVDMEVEWHDPVAANAQLEKLAEEVRSGWAGTAPLRGVELHEHSLRLVHRIFPCGRRDRTEDRQREENGDRLQRTVLHESRLDRVVRPGIGKPETPSGAGLAKSL